MNDSKRRSGSTISTASTSNETDRSGTAKTSVGTYRKGVADPEDHGKSSLSSMEEGERWGGMTGKEGSSRAADTGMNNIDERRKRLAAAAAAAGGAATRTAAKPGRDSVGIDNVAEAFGLSEEKDGGHRSLGGGSSYVYTSSTSKHHSVSTVGGGSTLGGGYGSSTGVWSGYVEDQHDDLKEASPVIVNPIFGDKSRAVGRQKQRTSTLVPATVTHMGRDPAMASESR